MAGFLNGRNVQAGFTAIHIGPSAVPPNNGLRNFKPSVTKQAECDEDGEEEENVVRACRDGTENQTPTPTMRRLVGGGGKRNSVHVDGCVQNVYKKLKKNKNNNCLTKKLQKYILDKLLKIKKSL
jgi:hypothetical protein